MKCKYEDCDRDAVAKGWCRSHYQQDYHFGRVGPLRERKILHMDGEGRVCTECETYKPWSDYYKQSGGRGYRSKCKDCLKAAERGNRLSRA